MSQVEFDRSAFRPAIVALLDHSDPMIRRTALGFIAALPPDEGDLARVTAMARDSDEELAYYAVYSCLSTQNNKDPDCVDLLIERLGAEDS